MAKKRGTQQGNPNPNPPPDDDDDEGGGAGFNDDQRNEIVGIVNAAVSGQLGRKLKGTLSGLLDEALAPIREQIEQSGSRRQARRDDDDDLDDDDDEPAPQPKSKGKGGKQQRAERDPEYNALQKKVKQLEDERKQEREQGIARERDTMVRETLTKLGVEPNRLRGAVAVVSQALKRDDKTGEWTYKAKRDGYDEDIDVSEGLKEWAGTDEGKSYLAPQGTQQPRGGSGFRQPNGGNGGSGPVLGGGRPTQDPKAAKVQAKQQAVQNLSAAIDQLGGATVTLGG